ncbi:hypothetical protein NDN08_008383 [Rhodosorus marinus]|uniref:Aminotransferase class I/classII large domain-containing protein n=1 Tax=Rhodosorus marinus TaxID=101924 RepID=A0AAV8V479_9RHOD|nr:hypothetical protein NDN08_008383 [Rhodosorus marinus]
MEFRVKLTDEAEDDDAVFGNPGTASLKRRATLLRYEEIHESRDKELTQDGEKLVGFKPLRKTGVIYVTEQAVKKGFSPSDPSWANFGQGAPETGDISGAPSRPKLVDIPPEFEEYAPVSGTADLRVAIANYYNEWFRQGQATLYTADNVCVVPGGRAGLTRIMSCIENAMVGYFLPDYTAYSEALGLFQSIVPVPIPQSSKFGMEKQMPANYLDELVSRMDLGAILMSNPCNPTGAVLRGRDLAAYVEIARRWGCAMVMDEFYSHYLYLDDDELKDSGDPPMVSAAEFVQDVNSDPVLLVNGLTKGWRLPGWRLCWVVGPKKHIDLISAAGSYLDGGANAPFQHAALPLLQHDYVRQDVLSLQAHFRAKRDYMLGELKKFRIHPRKCPEATFYLWLDLSELPDPINDGLEFCHELLEENAIVINGIWFDLSPRGLRRHAAYGPCANFIRLSYGPPMEELKVGVKAIERVCRKHGVETAM